MNQKNKKDYSAVALIVAIILAGSSALFLKKYVNPNEVKSSTEKITTEMATTTFPTHIPSKK